MQVGRVILILTENESDNLMSLLEAVPFNSLTHDNIQNAIEIKQLLADAKKTIIIDDYRPETLDQLPQ